MRTAPTQLAALAAALVLALPASGQSRDELQQRAKAILADNGCQSTLPEAQSGNNGSAAARRGHGVVGDRARKRGEDALHDGGIVLGTTFAQIVTWSLIAIAIITMIGVALRTARDAKFSPASPKKLTAKAAPPPAPADADRPAEHALLAAQGDYAGAIHALLRAALLRLHELLGNLRPSTTGREALVPAAKVDREALALLVLAVERSHFGGRSVTADDYAAATAAFARWNEACARAR